MSCNPRGKQTWKGKNFECFYLPNSGIWQSVLIETFNKDYIKVRSLFTDKHGSILQGANFTPMLDTLKNKLGETSTTYLNFVQAVASLVTGSF